MTTPVALERLLGWRLLEAEGAQATYEPGTLVLHLPR